MLRKCLKDLDVVVKPIEVEVLTDMTYVTGLVKMVEKDVKVLRNKLVNLVKIQWIDDDRDVTWELEETMRRKHPRLFQ